MMKRFYLILLIGIIVASCTKLNVEEDLPDLKLASPATMDSKLMRFNIVTDQDSFDYMYKNYYQDIRIRADIEYYTTTGDLVFTEGAKIRIRGSGSALNAMKSIGIVFDNKIDNSFHQMIPTDQALPTHDLSTLQSVRLRNSGNDDGTTQIKDLALTNFVIKNGLILELKYGNTAQAFVNGEYFGLFNLRSENDRVALSDMLHVDENSITMLKMDLKNGNLEYREGDEELADRLRQAIKDRNVFEIVALVDIPNFMDYIIYQDYVTNVDWPNNNARAYSVDGSRFKFLLYDLDFAVNRNKMYRLPKMEYLDDDISKIYQILREKKDGFIQDMENRQKELYAQFNPADFNVIADELADVMDGEIEYLIQKYGPPENTLRWRLNIEQLKRDFERNDYYHRRKYKID